MARAPPSPTYEGTRAHMATRMPLHRLRNFVAAAFRRRRHISFALRCEHPLSPMPRYARPANASRKPTPAAPVTCLEALSALSALSAAQETSTSGTVGGFFSSDAAWHTRACPTGITIYYIRLTPGYAYILGGTKVGRARKMNALMFKNQSVDGKYAKVHRCEKINISCAWGWCAYGCSYAQEQCAQTYLHVPYLRHLTCGTVCLVCHSGLVQLLCDFSRQGREAMGVAVGAH